MAKKQIRKGGPQLVLKDAKSKQIADAVIMAAFQGDEAAMQHFGITQRTLSRYRKRTMEVGELSTYVSYRLRELEDTGALDKVEAALNKGLESFTRISDAINPAPPEKLMELAENVAEIVKDIRKEKPTTKQAVAKQQRQVDTFVNAIDQLARVYTPVGAGVISAYAELFDVVANYDLTRKMLHERLQGVS